MGVFGQEPGEISAFLYGKKAEKNVEEMWKQGKSEGFDSCDRPSNLTQIGFKSSIFQPV